MVELTPEDLIDAAELGEEAKAFLESDLGKTLVARSEQAAQEALEEMGQQDEESESGRAAIRAAKVKLRAARMFPEWLQEIIFIGENAQTVWRQQNGT